MGKRRLNGLTYGVLLLVLVSLISPSVVSGAEPPPECFGFAYTHDGGEAHYSLISSNVFAFGTRLNAVSNCDDMTLEIDGVLVATSVSSSLHYTVSAGLHNVTLTSGNESFKQSWNNVQFLSAGSLSMALENLPASGHPDRDYYTPSDIGDIEMVSGIGSVIIAWVLVTQLLWRWVKSHQDRNFCEEVK